jgi:hypothetical protein
MYRPVWTRKISRNASMTNPTTNSSSARVTSGRRHTNESKDARACRRRNIQLDAKKGPMK